VTPEETFNADSTNNMLSFLTSPYTTGSIKQNQSYSDLKTAWKRRFQSKLKRNFGFGARVRISSRTEVREWFGQKWSMNHDIFRLGWISMWQVFQFRFTLLGRNCFGRMMISKIPTDWNWGRFRENNQHESCRYFLDLSIKYKNTHIRSTDQKLWSL
jgi:hypothetical protein